MIKWTLAKDKVPELGRKVIVLLPNNTVCSGTITETRGFKIDPVSNLDLFMYGSINTKWIYLD